MNTDALTAWFNESNIGQYVAEREQRFFLRNSQHIYANTVVQTGMPQWLLSEHQHTIKLNVDVRMNLCQLAWLDDSIDLFLMPHGLEYCKQPYLALAELYRVLKPEGRIILTGFNPKSLWGACRFLDGKQLPHKNSCLLLVELKKQLHELGFVVESGKFMIYLPPVNRQRSINRWQFMESAGGRWWPHAAAVYGLVLLKRQANIRPLPEFDKKAAEDNAMVFGAVARADLE